MSIVRTYPRARRGAIALMTAILLVVILGMIACAFDVGWILMTRTQLQAAADASALAGGTELLAGLGYSPTKIPSEVVAAGTPVAVDYAARHRNGDVASSFADGARDVAFGWATFTDDPGVPGAGTWSFDTSGQAGTGWYNAIEVTLHRTEAGSTNNDYPLPLIFAPVLGTDASDVTATARAVILPAKGFAIEKGSDETVDIMPFAVRKGFWDKYWRAQDYLDAHGEDSDDPLDLDTITLADLQQIPDPDSPTMDFLDPLFEPLFGHFEPPQNAAEDISDGVDDNRFFWRDFTDNWTCEVCATTNDDADQLPQANSDGKLELDVYPRNADATAGNFGTIDFGGADNSTSDIERQILDGVNEQDLREFFGVDDSAEVVELVIDETTGLDVQGDTGLSAGFKDELAAIRGQCRAVALFSSVMDPGNNAQFHLVGWAGVRIMDVKLTGSEEYKNVTAQFCKVSLPGAIGSTDEEIGEDTTVFTPLILIR